MAILKLHLRHMAPILLIPYFCSRGANIVCEFAELDTCDDGILSVDADDV